MKKSKASVSACPCGSGESLADCCGRYHAGEAPPSAECLMRSRYSAYAIGLAPYILATWHASTRPAVLELDAGVLKWVGLEVRAAQEDGDAAAVSFVARFKDGGRAGRLVETSRFVREDGRWFYVDGDLA